MTKPTIKHSDIPFYPVSPIYPVCIKCGYYFKPEDRTCSCERSDEIQIIEFWNENTHWFKFGDYPEIIADDIHEAVIKLQIYIKSLKPN